MFRYIITYTHLNKLFDLIYFVSGLRKDIYCQNITHQKGAILRSDTKCPHTCTSAVNLLHCEHMQKKKNTTIIVKTTWSSKLHIQQLDEALWERIFPWPRPIITPTSVFMKG